jgi:hypothetical protein
MALRRAALRATGLIARNPATSEVRSTRLDLLDGFEPRLLKFDGVAVTKEQENSPLRSILW